MTIYNSVSPSTNGKQNEVTSFIYRLRDKYNFIPLCGKFPPCIKWKPYQTTKVTDADLAEWSKNRFTSKRGKTWSAELLNWGLLTGSNPYSDAPALVVVDTDDQEADDIVKSRCPDTPVKQITGKGGTHRVYRRPPVTEIGYIPNRQKTVYGGKQYNIDIRADGGYIVCPGCTHPDTKKLYTQCIPWTLELISQCPVYDPTWIPCEREQASKKKSASKTGQAATVDADADFLFDPSFFDSIQVPLALRIESAQQYLAACPGTQQGNGADRSCANLAVKLIWGFALSPETACELLYDWGQKESQLDEFGNWYPWEEYQIKRKIAWALQQNYQCPIGDKLPEWDDAGDVEKQTEILVAQGEPAAPEQPIRKRRGYKIDELANLPKPEWIIRNHAQLNTLVLVNAPWGIGKTFFSLDMALSVATGKPFLNTYDTCQSPAMYIISEGIAGFHKRCMAWLSYYGKPSPDNFIVVPHAFSLLHKHEGEEALRIAKADLGCLPRFIVIDTLARNFGLGDENGPVDMSSFVNVCDGMRRVCKATVVIVTHPPSHQHDKPRGHNSLAGAVHTLINLRKGKDVVVSCAKQKDDEEFKEYVLQKSIVQVGEGTSLVLTPRPGDVSNFLLLPIKQKRFLDLVCTIYGMNTFAAKPLYDKVAKSTLHRYLAELVDKHLITKIGDSGYRLTQECFQILLDNPVPKNTETDESETNSD